MNNQRFELGIKTDGTGDGPEQVCKDLADKEVEIGGALAGGRKLSIWGTISGITWFSMVANIVTPGGLFPIAHNIWKIRIRTDVLGSGATTAYLLGRNTETTP